MYFGVVRVNQYYTNAGTDYGVVFYCISSHKRFRNSRNSDSLYRGTEHRVAVESFVKVKREYDAIADEDQKRSYVWQKAKELGQYGRYKNSAIGTLLSAISEGEDLTKAVNSFESMVAGPNYKRSSAVVTPSMIKQAQEKIRALGLEPSLERRLATKNDITVNNVLFTSVLS